MIIQFKIVEIHNFMSIGSAKVVLDNQGLTLVKGINQYEPKLDSNGSGKSAIFESIIWCLTGQTTRNAKEVVNLYATDKESYVKLKFILNQEIYEICRSQLPSKELIIIKNTEDISGATLTKSKDILNGILGDLTYDRLISIILLSQGLPGRFSELSPSARKSRLESLSHTSELLPKLIDKVDKGYQEASQLSNQLLREISRLEGSISSAKASIKIMTKSLSPDQELIDEKDRIYLESRIKELSIEKTAKQSGVLSTKTALSNHQSDLLTLTVSRTRLESQTEELKSKIKSFSNNRCPTCGASRDFSKEIDQSIRDLNKLIESLSDILLQIDVLNEMILELTQISKEEEQKLNEIIKEINNLKNQLDLDKKEREGRSSLESGIVKLNNSIVDFSKELETVHQEQSSCESQLELYSYLKNNLNKKFRTYLINSVVDFMNEKLSQISKYLYQCQGVVKLECSGNNINIYLGDRDISTLSGGELRRVDLILQLAQRSLCEYYSGFSCNLLVLDEILDYLDAQGVENVLSMMESKSNDVSSIMIVSHRTDLELASDTEITVIKDESQISRIIQ